jgi:hypothetical protein
MTVDIDETGEAEHHRRAGHAALTGEIVLTTTELSILLACAASWPADLQLPRSDAEELLGDLWRILAVADRPAAESALRAANEHGDIASLVTIAVLLTTTERTQ